MRKTTAQGTMVALKIYMILSQKRRKPELQTKLKKKTSELSVLGAKNIICYVTCLTLLK